MKYQIDLPPSQIAALTILAEDRGQSKAALIRDAIRDFLAKARRNGELA